ncbi:hypothetical protein CEXT_94441 [Caerostris extrusa]|uniref:Uncharacterized protein n=1 Tax=Caerostris extrusa TaxID=172846 RepID=A0AAV4Y1G6_CAEEX|nr:hypothetical protein CEXT_94441 [Caerostris extrusa]
MLFNVYPNRTLDTPTVLSSDRASARIQRANRLFRTENKKPQSNLCTQCFVVWSDNAPFVKHPSKEKPRFIRNTSRNFFVSKQILESADFPEQFKRAATRPIPVFLLKRPFF